MSSSSSAAESPMPARTFLGFDYGLRRIGVASGNALTRTATPLATLRADDPARLATQLQQLLDEWKPDALVVGIPFHPDGAVHDTTRRAERFARRLGQFGLPVHRVDERYSSVEAQSRGAADVDAAAAAVILEQFLNAPSAA